MVTARARTGATGYMLSGEFDLPTLKSGGLAAYSSIFNRVYHAEQKAQEKPKVQKYTESVVLARLLQDDTFSLLARWIFQHYPMELRSMCKRRIIDNVKIIRIRDMQFYMYKNDVIEKKAARDIWI